MDLTSKIKLLARHWILALPVLLIATALSFGQFNRYTPSRDEFFSMHRAGFLVGGPYAPGDLIEALWAGSPDHMPGFFLLLSAWGNLAGTEAATLRLPGIFAALLSLAMAYRLSRDAVAPAAGLAGLLIIAGNAHYNFYYDHIRMYSLVVFVSGGALWLYLRLSNRRQAVGLKDLVAFGLAIAALVSLHLINALLFLAALSAYHLFFAPKTRQWLAAPLAIAVALLCLSPALLAVATAGLQSWELRDFSHTIVDGAGFARGHLAVMLNDQPLLGLALLLSLLRGAAARRSVGAWLIWIMGLAALLILFGLMRQFGLKHLRYSLSLLMPFALFMAAGLYGFRGRLRPLAPLILLLYLAAGFAFQASGEWRGYLAWGRVDSLFRLPLHTVSDMALRAELKPRLYLYHEPDHPFYWLKSFDNYSEKHYYFARHGIAIQRIQALEDMRTSDATTTPVVWLAHQPAHGVPDLAMAQAMMEERGYQLCQAHDLAAASDLLRFGWRALACDAPLKLLAQGETEAIVYQFYGARSSADGEKLYFADRWRAKNGASLQGLRLSWQMISAADENAAQLDLPLAAEGELRQYAIDVSGLVAGEYRLMAALYEAESGKRMAWRDGAGMLELAGVAVS